MSSTASVFACNCIGGPNCCVNQLRPPATGPFKCWECGTWWAGEHRCPPPPASTVPWIGGASGTATVRCTCPTPGGVCLIHNITVS